MADNLQAGSRTLHQRQQQQQQQVTLDANDRPAVRTAANDYIGCGCRNRLITSFGADLPEERYSTAVSTSWGVLKLMLHVIRTSRMSTARLGQPARLEQQRARFAIVSQNNKMRRSATVHRISDSK